MNPVRDPLALIVLCAFLIPAVQHSAGASADGGNGGGFVEETVRFESASHPGFAYRSKFTGTATVKSNFIDVSIESAVISWPDHAQTAAWREILGYKVGLSTKEWKSYKTLGQSPMVDVESNRLTFGSQVTFGPSRTTVPLVNITERTNHWLTFIVYHVSNKRSGLGTTEGNTPFNLFTNLVPTGLIRPDFFGDLSGMTFGGFMQKHWTNFPAIKFGPRDAEGGTVLQPFKTSENVVGTWGGRDYTGVRLTFPDWLDGDLEYAFVYDFRSQLEFQRRPRHDWGIIDETGLSFGMDRDERVPFQDHAVTQARFPFTDKGYMGTVKLWNLKPGKTYVFWWLHSWDRPDIKRPPLDMAIGFTIVSDRGRREFGEIVWR